MHLKLASEPLTHISHFHHFVSAYETNKEMVDKLIEMIDDALKTAKGSLEPVIVEQDCLEHIFVVYPSGTIGLYRIVGRYEVVRDE